MRFERFETPRAVSASLTLAATDVSVSTWDEPAIEIEIDGRRDDDATRAAIKAFTVEARPRGDGHTVTIKESPTRGFGFRLRSPSLALRVRCPHGTDLMLSSESSDLVAGGELGAVELKTGSCDASLDGRVASLRSVSASGDLRVAAATGDVTVTTASGDVWLGQVDGDVTVNAVSGDVVVGDGTGDVAVQTISGDVSLLALGGGDLRAQTVSGDVHVGLAPGVAAWIDASSVSGDVQSELDVDDGPPAGESGRVVAVRLKTVSGDIEIARTGVVA